MFSTIHAVKGLQWDSVFVIGVDDKIFPAMDFIQNGPVSEVLAGARSIEAERRLMYVAMTRAKNYLNIYGAPRSTFLDELAGDKTVADTEVISVRRVVGDPGSRAPANNVIAIGNNPGDVARARMEAMRLSAAGNVPVIHAGSSFPAEAVANAVVGMTESDDCDIDDLLNILGR